MASKMYTGNPHATVQFLEKRSVEVVRTKHSMFPYTSPCYVRGWRNDFPGKRAMANDGLLLLQDDDEGDCHPSQGK